MIKLLVAVLIGAVPAAPNKMDVLAQWTQPTAASFQAWDAARVDQPAWQAYGFTWTSDDCTGSPDRPAGFDFRLACRRHDFGYRNYRAVGALAEHKDRLDRAFHADLSRTCRKYRLVVRPVCALIALTYFVAVRAA
jgi:hypothetical protein